MRSGRFRTARRGGFTLLELVLAIGLLAILVGMIFSVASQNVALGNAVVTEQNEVSEEAALFALLGERLSSLPGNAELDLVVEDSGAQYLTTLTLQGVPLSFSWGGAELVAKTVTLKTERRRDGFLDLVLRYYESEILDPTQEVGSPSRLLDEEPFAEVILMEDIYIFEWRVLDGRTLEWDYEWQAPGRLPLQLELNYVRDAYADPVRQIFWITPIQDPELMMQQLQQGGGGAQPGAPGGGEQPGEGEPGEGGETPSDPPGQPNRPNRPGSGGNPSTPSRPPGSVDFIPGLPGGGGGPGG